MIMSQLVGALLPSALAEAGADDRSAAVFAEALAAGHRRGVRRGRRSRSRAPSSPSPGPPSRGRRPGGRRTEADLGARGPGRRRRAPREALARTPEQLQVLRDAGVVDAGGRGLCVVLDAAETRWSPASARPAASAAGGSPPIPVPLPTRRPAPRTGRRTR